jgi:hypothetical protein
VTKISCSILASRVSGRHIDQRPVDHRQHFLASTWSREQAGAEPSDGGRRTYGPEELGGWGGMAPIGLFG